MTKRKKTSKEAIDDKPKTDVAELVFYPTEETRDVGLPNKKHKITIPRLRSLRFRLWISFIVMTLITLTILWVYEYVYYTSFYVNGESQELNKIGSSVVKEYEDIFDDGNTIANEQEFQNYINNVAIVENVNIIVNNSTENITFISTNNAGIVISGLKPKVEQYIIETITEDGEKYLFDTTTQNEINDKIIIFGYKNNINSSQLLFCVFSEMPQLSSARNALIFQLFILSLVCLLIGIVVAFFGSNIISKPIHDVTLLIANSTIDGKNERIPEKNKLAEIDELAAAFNKTMDKVDENSKFRRDLLANISHDMKTPLTMIRAYAEMIRDLTGGDKEKSAKNASIIISESDRLTQLITEIIELSKLESGTYELHPAFFSISEMVKETKRHFDIMHVSKGYEINLDVDDEIFVNADSERIERVLYNLLGNAINYTGEDKKVTISCKKKKGVVRVEVIDTGNGLTEDEMKDIWVKYYRLVQDKRKSVGSGLGLTIVKNILNLHGCTYGVKSIKNKGSNFWFELPIVTEKLMKKANQ